MTLDNQLEQEIVNMGTLVSGLNNYNDADPTIRGKLAKTAAFVLGGREEYNEFLGHLRASDTAYTSIVEESIETRAEEIKDNYSANINIIVSDVAGKMEEKIAEAKAEAEEKGRNFGGADAIMTVARILKSALNIRKPNAGYARSLKAHKLAEIGKVKPSILTGITADPDEGHDLLIRAEAAKYVIAGENGYSINKEALSELMTKDIYAGTNLYSATRPRER